MGKTTLANNLFAAYCREGDPDMSDGPRTVQEFTEDPEAGLTDIEVQVQPEESDPITSFHYYIQVRSPLDKPMCCGLVCACWPTFCAAHMRQDMKRRSFRMG